MTRLVGSKWALVTAFAATIVGTALLTAVVVEERVSRAQPADPPTPAPAGGDDYSISAYFVDAKTPTNGFIVINRRTGKVSNCVANWQGKKDAKCYDWSSWVKLP